MRSTGGGVRTTLMLFVAAWLIAACAATSPPALERAPPRTAAAAPSPIPSAPDPTPSWPDAWNGAFAGRGDPHAQPIAIPRDARGRARWLAFAGTRDVAWGAWRVARAEDGTTEIEPVEHWPSGVRVVGGVVEGGVAYVLVESLGALDQPAGLRSAWIDTGGGPPSPFEASPMALADVRDAEELASRVKHPPSVERDPAALLSTLRTAGVSAAALANSLAKEGADVRIAWQALFTQRVGHVDADSAATSPLAGAVLAVIHDALVTQACGADACEAWTEGGRAIVRFVKQEGRWGIRSVIEDAPVTRSPDTVQPRTVPSEADTTETRSLLLARAREVRQVIGQAQLDSSNGGMIGIGLTDWAPDSPVVVMREGAALRAFVVEAGAVRAEMADARWDAAFADADGDGRTDVVVRLSGTGAGGLPVAWTEAFLSPPPSMQVSSLEADLPSALAVMDTPDANAAARAAASIPPHGVSHDEACRLLAGATTPSGFRRLASPDARLMHFDEPRKPTWRPKVIPIGKLAVDDLRAISAHCAEMTCSPSRPYCAWVGGSDSEHFWFGWRDGRLELLGAADYNGE
jgi:hypothetical protein